MGGLVLILTGCATPSSVAPPGRLLMDAAAIGCEWNATQMRWHYPHDAAGNSVMSPIYDITNCVREGTEVGCRWQWRCPP